MLVCICITCIIVDIVIVFLRLSELGTNGTTTTINAVPQLVSPVLVCTYTLQMYLSLCSIMLKLESMSQRARLSCTLVCGECVLGGVSAICTCVFVYACVCV